MSGIGAKVEVGSVIHINTNGIWLAASQSDRTAVHAVLVFDPVSDEYLRLNQLLEFKTIPI